MRCHSSFLIPKACLTCEVRVGVPADAEAWRTASMLLPPLLHGSKPETLGFAQHGAPYLLSPKQFGVRSNDDRNECPGVGSIIHQRQGSSLVFFWDWNKITESGGKSHDGIEMLSGFSGVVAKRWLDDHATVLCLQAGVCANYCGFVMIASVSTSPHENSFH